MTRISRKNQTTLQETGEQRKKDKGILKPAMNGGFAARCTAPHRTPTLHTWGDFMREAPSQDDLSRYPVLTFTDGPEIQPCLPTAFPNRPPGRRRTAAGKASYWGRGVICPD